MVGGTLQPESLIKYADANGIVHNAIVLAVAATTPDPDVEQVLGTAVAPKVNLVYVAAGVATTVNNVVHVSKINPPVSPPVSCWFYA